MKIKGLEKLKKDTEAMQDIITKKIDDIDWDKKGADEKDEELNDAWNGFADILIKITELEDL